MAEQSVALPPNGTQTGKWQRLVTQIGRIDSDWTDTTNHCRLLESQPRTKEAISGKFSRKVQRDTGLDVLRIRSARLGVVRKIRGQTVASQEFQLSPPAIGQAKPSRIEPRKRSNQADRTSIDVKIPRRRH